MRRRELLALIGGAAIWPLPAQGQQVSPRVLGVLALDSLEVVRAAMRAGFILRRLAEMGYVEGQNLVIEYRGADGYEERLKELAADLVQRRVDVIVATSGPPIVAAKSATTSIPIIFFTGFDPVASGFVASLNRPGSNVTGISVLNTEMNAKRIEVLRELVPTAKSIGSIYSPTNLVSGYDRLLKDVQ